MKRIILILIVAAIGGYFAYDYFQGKAKETAVHEAHEKERELRRAAVARMVTKYNAEKDWSKILRKGAAASGKSILTIELEKLWLIDKPIFFKGRIKDIVTFDEDNYLIKLDVLPKFNTKLALTLRSPKNKIDSFLRANPKSSSGLATVAVIAKINKIENNLRKTEEGDEEEIRTGVGQCIDILLYNDFFLEYLLEEGGKEE